jgi:exo-beta-1,3-glucanase (GH17 family)
MNKLKLIFVLLGVIIVSSCNNEEKITVANTRFTVDNNYILKNNIPYPIKGVVYVPGYPGYLPWEIEKSITLPAELKNNIATDIANIKALGVNTIRFWGAPKYCYEALKKVGDLNFIQTIWIKGDEPDFQNTAFKETTKAYIREVVDRIYSVFDTNSPPLIAYLIGNELSEASILSTDAKHPEINTYTGNYIKTDSNCTATEAFLAEMADYAKSYEFETYNHVSLVSYANDIRTADIIDAPFLDFISQNAYSYAVPYYRPHTSLGSNSGTIFQGWIEELKSKHPNKPLLITETGLSVSPNANHVGAPNFGYGGNTELEQTTGLLQNINDINTTALPTAGVCIHEYLDAWWKFGLEDSYSQDPNDIEEWFGIVKLIQANGYYTTEFRNSYNTLKNTWN